jgi:hypothetical protein
MILYENRMTAARLQKVKVKVSRLAMMAKWICIPSEFPIIWSYTKEYSSWKCEQLLTDVRGDEDNLALWIQIHRFFNAEKKPIRHVGLKISVQT